MKITLDLNAGLDDQIVLAEDKSGSERATARFCLKTLNVLKARNFSGSQLMAIESIVKALRRSVEALPSRL